MCPWLGTPSVKRLMCLSVLPVVRPRTGPDFDITVIRPFVSAQIFFELELVRTSPGPRGIFGFIISGRPEIICPGTYFVFQISHDPGTLQTI